MIKIINNDENVEAVENVETGKENNLINKEIKRSFQKEEKYKRLIEGNQQFMSQKINMEEINEAMKAKPDFLPSKSFNEEQLSIHNKESIT